MSAVNPTQNTALIVDEFIKYAQAHLGTVSGIVNMTTLYQAGPATIAAPGLVNWTGYNVESARPTPTQLNQDDFPAKENVDTQNSQLQTNEIQNGTTEEDVDKIIKKEKEDLSNIPDEDTPVKNIDDILEVGTFNTGKPFVSGFRSGGGGFQGGGGTKVDLGKLDLSAPWLSLAAKFIGGNEGFTEVATWDVNAYRLGFGSDKIMGADGKIRDVYPPASYYKQTGEERPAIGDRTTVEAALKMLEYELAGPYKNRLVGTADYKIPEATFDALNNKQKAALISYVYNVGSLRPGIAAAIRAGNFSSAVTQIQAGPVTPEKYRQGLQRRRNEEATLFST